MQLLAELGSVKAQFNGLVMSANETSGRLDSSVLDNPQQASADLTDQLYQMGLN